MSKLRAVAHNVPQTVCHNCGEILLGADSLEVICLYEKKSKQEMSEAVG